MACIVHPDLDHEFLDQRVEEVEEQFEGEEYLDYTYVFIRDTDDCMDLSEEIDTEHRDEFIQICEREGSSSFRIDDTEYILITIDRPFLEENKSACRGLIAHELVHTVQRATGLEEEIEEAGQAYTDSVAQELTDRGFTKDDAIRFIKTVLSTAILCLKDIYANTELIRQGFSEDLEEYYYHMLDINDYCPLPKFYNDEESLEDIEAALAFDIRLIPAWLPFEGLDREKSQEIKDRIQECYQSNIPQTSYHVDKIRHLYHDEFHKSDQFKTKFFQKVLESSYNVIDKKLD